MKSACGELLSGGTTVLRKLNHRASRASKVEVS
ncbi:hypothetical protein HD842_001065 [Massilia aurea]|jgi:hypothetical protein|uniref:Uncharacterized protein n=1 Tax=Massilia aurea TaxID=373040 RepID=A0A7W9WY25_9BURK|nr:hypothetical protein [Massilia aurea]